MFNENVHQLVELLRQNEGTCALAATVYCNQWPALKHGPQSCDNENNQTERLINQHGRKFLLRRCLLDCVHQPCCPRILGLIASRLARYVMSAKKR